MKLEVLLSAMHLKDYKYVDSLNIISDCVVINQCDTNSYQEVIDNGRKIKFISTTDRGLSLSRNMALNNADGDICIFCDNDVEYVPNYQEIILEEYRNNPDYGIIVFFVERRRRLNSKPYFKKRKKIGYLTSMKIFSPEITFRREILDRKKIRFNPEFGAGAKYSMGEENIFLYECLKKGIKILYVPIKIAKLRDEESTWFKGYTRKYFHDIGAVYYAMSKSFSLLFIVQFWLRKYRVYKSQISFMNAIKFMLQGRSEYKIKASKKG
jgi:glycosyltransferase involved in cell wall biosynthesis